MNNRQLCLCLTVLTSTAACGDDGSGETSDDGSSSGGATVTDADTDATETATPTTSEGDPSTGDDGSTTDDGTTGEPLDNPFPAGGCGLPEYPILPATDMGEVLDHAFVIHFDADVIDGLLEGQGFGALAPVAFGADVYKIRYRTQDRGEAVEATGFVSYPTSDGDDVGERPVVVWAHGTSGFTDKCGPTAAADGYVVPALLAALGFVTVAPDYLGMNGWGAPSGFIHPYIVPEPTAIATLDSLRAVVRFAGDTGEAIPATPGKDIILFGASEGGFATLWADRYAPLYAPEFKILANVASVPPTDAFGLTKHGATVFGPTTGALAAAIVGGHDWYRLPNPLSEVLADGEPNVSELLPELMANDCGADVPDGITMTNQVYQQSFIDAIEADDLDALGQVGCILKKASLGASELPFTVFTPTLIVQGENDDLVYTPVVRDDLPKLCDQGYVLEHYECAGAGHTDAATSSIPFVIDWANARIAGKPLADPCVIHEPVDCQPPMP